MPDQQGAVLSSSSGGSLQPFGSSLTKPKLSTRQLPEQCLQQSPSRQDVNVPDPSGAAGAAGVETSPGPSGSVTEVGSDSSGPPQAGESDH